MEQSQDIRELVSRVRTRWRRVVVLRATGRTALALSGVLATLLLLALVAGRVPIVLAGLAIAAVALALGSAVWGLRPARDVPSDRRVARFIEEHEPSLDDRLVSAVDLLGREAEKAPALAASMVTDANHRAAQIDPASIVSTRSIGRAALWAAAAVLLVAVLAFLGRGTARSSFGALSFLLFPSGVTLDVTPGDVRIAAGSPLTVEARLAGDDAPVDVQVLRTDTPADPTEPVGAADTEWQAADMTRDASGTFRFAIESVDAPFRYRVVAGAMSSPIYGVTVARAPRVTRIDVEYIGASALGFEPRVEADSGDIFAPAGTDVRLMVHTDVEAAKGQMRLANGTGVDLSADGLVLTGAFKVVENTSYRVALADAEGLTNPGDIEYFIRTLEDRPPDVRLSKPARDREATRLEEVDIEAQADDDFGVDVLELVYAKGGGPETVVPLAIERQAKSVTTAHTLQLENLNLQTGDFISYYVRARDVARGKPPSEARSDIFFLHVRPFEQEFQLAQGQPPPGGGANRALDDVVTAQKEIILATWRLDRRTQASSGAVSEEDIRSVSLAESELQARVEETSSSFRTSVMRDPRRPAQPAAPGGASPAPRAGVPLPEEDSMSAAAESMGRAVWSLDLLDTAEALPHEMEALGHLLKAQGDVRRREVGRQQTGSGTGDNRTSQDLSGLFDKELQREQQTNYETPAPPPPPAESTQSALDKIKELAYRQEALARRQQDVADEQKQLTPEELKQELGELAKEQNSLSQRAGEMSRQMSEQQQPGQESQSGQQGQTAQGMTASGRQLRAASDEMRRAASELQRQNPEQAAASASRALGQLRQVEQQLGATAPDERRRALGEMQLEARQLADAQRRVGLEAGKLEAGDQNRDAMRRMAGEQERLAERASQLQDGLERQAASPLPENRSETDAARQLQRTAGDAAQEIERQQIVERMEQAASEMRSTAGGDQATERGARSEAQRAGERARAGQEIAQTLERIADQLATAVAPQDDESKQLAAQLAEAQQLREKLEGLTRELERLDREADERQARDQAANAAGRGGQRQEGGDTSSEELARLRDEMARQVQETREMIESLGRENPEVAQGGTGLTFESGGMTLSDPGTEAFKQDFTQWEQLQQQLTQALEKAESSLAERLRARASRDRLASSPDDVPPAEYQQQVDSYFKALATKKKP